MDIRCPSCQTLYEFNEERLKRGPVNLKCSQCSHIFRVESRQSSAPKARRWMLRRHPSGELLYFKGLNTLQKWIVDRKVTRDDEISKTSKKWKRLGDIGELASFFQVADSIPDMHTNPTRQMPTMARPGASKPDRATTALAEAAPLKNAEPQAAPEVAVDDVDYFDPLAPEPGLDDLDSSASVDWSLAASSEHNAQWAFDGQAEGLPGPALMSSVSMDLAPPSTPPGAQSGPVVIAGTYDDPLDDEEPQGSNPVKIAVVLLALLIAGVVVIALLQPSWLGLKSDQTAQGVDTSTPAPSDSATDTGQDQGDADDGSRGEITPKDETAQGDADSKDDPTLKEASQGGAAAGAADQKASTKASQRKANKRGAASQDPGGADKAAQTPRGFDGLMDKASAALRVGNGQEALRLYSQAEAKRPSSIPALVGKGRSYMSLGQPQGAIQAYEKALSISPGNGLAMAGLADAYRISGQTQKAITLYKRYLDRYPEGPTAERVRRVLSSLGASP